VATIAALVARVLGDAAERLPVAIEAYDGSRLGPADAPATIVVRSPDALVRLAHAPSELGLGRAYVTGDLDVQGDIFAALELRDALPMVRIGARHAIGLARLAGVRVLRPLPPPSEEARLHGRRHSKARDAAAIAHHYDVSNDFYRLVLGPSLTYSCAVWTDGTTTLEDAQANKHELICSKLGLEPGMRLLDIGCGWGGMLLHAAREHGVRAVGVTVSRAQAELAAKRVADAGLGDRVEVRLQDYRDVDDGPYEAVSSIGMFEHVGLSRLATYFSTCFELLAPEGRLLNHGISRPAHGRTRRRTRRRTPPHPDRFIDRYVFPDGELHELGVVVSAIQHAGFEARHVESLREHYARTLRCWVQNLERDWADAVCEVGERRARVWRLYMAASAVNFENDRTQVHQVLATKTEHGRSGLPLRPQFVP